MNKIILVGRLTRDPELRTTPNGISVCSLSLAVSRRMDRDKTDFFDITVWRQAGENCAKYLSKGRQVAVEGEMQMDRYEAKDGSKRTVYRVVAVRVEFLSNSNAGAGNYSGEPDYSQRRPAASAPRAQEAQRSAAPEENVFESEFDAALIDDNDLPF